MKLTGWAGRRVAIFHGWSNIRRKLDENRLETPPYTGVDGYNAKATPVEIPLAIVKKPYTNVARL